MLKFITIRNDSINRTSSLAVGDDRLMVIGLLPHNYEFTLATVDDAIKLKAWAQAQLDAFIEQSR